ncbi:sphingomyelin phosphodiesterase [Crocinitomicaceae bacterium]|nr:sphingomyelin phosphodiesterase [Crocinitomicaceae bacterium]
MRIVKSYLFFLIVALAFQGKGQQSSIKVLSWNVFLRPSIMNDGQMDRVCEIGDYLKNSGADVLVLQEVFHSRARRALKNQLKSTYPYQTKKGPVTWLGIPSGVVFFSKIPIVKEKVVSFSFSKGADRLAKKGAILVTFEKNGQEISILGTHLQAGSDLSRKKIRNAQINEISDAVNAIDSNRVLIYAGDFNIKNKSNMFVKLKNKLKSNNPKLNKISFREATANFQDNTLYPGSGKPVWIDYILIRRAAKVKQKALWVEEPRGKKRRKNKRLSDHNPVVSIVSYEKKH